MEYMVVIIIQKETHKIEKECIGFMELEDAKEFADCRSTMARENGYDFDIAIYERTNH